MQAEDTLSAPQQPKVDLSGFLAGFDENPQAPETKILPTAGEAAQSAMAGAQNGAAEMLRTADDLANYINDRFGTSKGDAFSRVAETIESDYKPESVGGAFIQGASQFGVGLLGVNKITKPLSFLRSLGKTEAAAKALGVASTAARGAAAEGVAFDPHQARISNLLQDAGVDNTIVNALAAKPDDTNLQGRFKSALEGAGMSFLFDGVVHGFKTMGKAAKDLPPDIGKKVSDYVYNIQTAQWLKKTKADLVSSIFSSDDPVIQTRAAKMAKPDGAIERAIKEAETSANEAKAGFNVEGPEGIQVDIQGPKKTQFSFTPEQAIKAVEVMNKSGPLEEIINTSNMSSAQDALRAINATAKVLRDSGKINPDVQTWEQTGNLAQILGSDKKTLFSNLEAIGGSTEEVAAHLEAANSFMQGLAAKVSKMSAQTDMTPEQIADHVNTINMLANVTAQYRGITKNIGRGLQILRKNKLPMEGIDTLDVNDVLGTPEGRLRYQQMAKLIAAQGGNLANISKVLSPSSRAWMAFNEYYINNLLSSPTTATVNTVSGAANNLFMPAEKALAGLFKGDIAEIKAAGATYKGVFDGMLDAVRLFSKTQDGLQFDPGAMWKVLRSGKNILDNQNSIDHPSAALDTRFLFSVDPNDLKGVKLIGSKLFDMFGKFVRLPSHVIAASDEVLKTMATRGEMHRQLYLEGYKTGLSGAELSKFIKDGIDNPSKEMWDKAIKYARETTFTQDLPEGGLGRGVQQFVAQHPAARLFIPFVRTPVNIMKFSFTHTPGLNLLVKEARQELKNDPAMFMSKMATGTVFYTAAAGLALNGNITGAGPRNKAEREAWLAAGNQQYSVKIGDTWYQYNRLDPYGSFFGMTADAVDLLAKAPTGDSEELATIMMASLARNVTSKTFLRGLSDLIAAISEGDPNKWSKVIGNVASGSIPMSGLLNTINRTQLQEHTKETFDLMDKIAARIPGLSDKLPPVRNIWGEEVAVPEAIGPDLISPFYAKRKTDDYKEKIAEEITRLGIAFGKPDKYVGDPANRYEFTPEQYDRLVTLMGRDIAIKGKNLPETLQELMNSPLYLNKMTDGDAAFEGTRASAILRVRQAFLQMAHVQMAKEYPDYDNYRQKSLMMKAATRRIGGDAILQQLSLPSQ